MEFGVSSACLYPMDTDLAAKSLVDNGINYMEIFLNTHREMQDEYIQKLKDITDGKNVISIHPFTSSFETFYFATDYPTRVDDGIEVYKELFKVCQKLGSKIVVFHGDHLYNPYDFKKHCDNYLRLRKEAREYGVDFAYENVDRCKCGYPDNIKILRDRVKDDVSFVLDLKQARRGKISIDGLVEAMSGKIVHLHLSDGDDDNICLAPGKGDFDFKALFSKLKSQDYKGNGVVELYRNNFFDEKELTEAVNFLYNCI